MTARAASGVSLAEATSVNSLSAAVMTGPSGSPVEGSKATMPSGHQANARIPRAGQDIEGPGHSGHAERDLVARRELLQPWHTQGVVPRDDPRAEGNDPIGFLTHWRVELQVPELHAPAADGLRHGERPALLRTGHKLTPLRDDLRPGCAAVDPPPHPERISAGTETRSDPASILVEDRGS